MNENSLKRKKIIADIALALALISVAVILLVILKHTKSDGAFVRVSVGGDTVAEYPLSKDGEYSLNGGTNLLVIKDGEAYIAEADCPDKVCVNSGKISLSGERIVCLPNKLVVSVVADGEEILP